MAALEVAAWVASSTACRAGLTIVPVVPWQRAPAAMPPPLDQLPNFYHAVLTFERLV